MKKTIAVYPGSFDPVTLGHLDIIHRGAALFDGLVVAVAVNITKTNLFSVESRIRFLQSSLGALPQVEVTRMDGLLVDYVKSIGASAVLRGLRSVADYESEAHMAAMNQKLLPGLETVFLIASESTYFISSRLLKEIAGMGGDISPFVPPGVAPELNRQITTLLRDRY